MEEQPQPKRKTIEPNFTPKDKRPENAVKADSAEEVKEDKNSSKLCSTSLYLFIQCCLHYTHGKLQFHVELFRLK